MSTIIRDKAIITFASAMVSLSVFAQSTDQNYLMEKTMLDANGANVIKSVQYYNGLGYPTVSAVTTGDNGYTSYSLVTYDGLGREACKYVPVSKDNSILYKAPGTISLAYTDNTPYSKTLYDALDRPISVTTPGATFASKPTRMEYAANAANEVICYGVSSSNSLTQNGYYPAGSLAKETTTDPDGKKTETFKNLLGNTVMQRTGGSLCTYYVYDNLNLLRFVLPPKYQTDKNLAATCYEYRYDYRGRVNYKQLPGAGYVEYWYDNADRMIFMRDAEMRSAGKYHFYIYDKFNHLVVQGLCSSLPSSTAVFDATLAASGGLLSTGYSYPSGLGTVELEIANYYDGSQSGNSRFSSLTLPNTSVSQKGLLTGIVTAATNGELLVQAMQYDIKGNVINSKAKDIGGRIVSNTSSYTFTNQLDKSTTTIDVKYGGSMTVIDDIGYNMNNGQKSSDAITVNHGTAKSVTTTYAHDNLGRLSTLSRPSSLSSNRNVAYAYDLRSWLTGITTSTFIEELFYTNGPGTAYYNGNISSIRWKDNSQSAKRGYKFTYDTANRLTSGAYGEGDALGSNTGRYSESMSYDANGNITSLTRYGKGTLMDNLTISYTGNQPTSVSESASDNNTSGSFEYKKANGSGYIFNANGALVADKSRGIAYITYDLNNNPKQIYFTNGSVTKYVYSASGQKLRAVHYTAKPNITRTWGEKPAELTVAQILLADSTDYLLGGSLTMKNGKVDKYLFEGGYAQASVASSTTDSFAFYYYNQDHLGNIREVVNASGSVQQVTNYYPFGAPYADAAGSSNPDFQPYKYNGKELDKMHGLNTYDYGARQHDPILARWDRIDPLCEKYYSVSPYVYCANNPIMFVDLHGDSITIDNQSIAAIYNGLEDGSHIHMKFNNGVLDPSSISEAVSSSEDTFLQDLYEIAINPQMVELKVTDKNEYVMNGKQKSEEWKAPVDFNVEKAYSGAMLDQVLSLGYSKGTTISGNLGQTLYPSQGTGLKSSKNGKIQILINSKGTLNHRTIGIAHEFAHVTLFLRGLPHSHSNNGDYIYSRQLNVMKRLGYDYVDW
ncbi:MAG: RHS repeat-associated core domain-containing protein [Prevotella ruminicola]|uniref:RHS repeat-associated core domain-containing protein n=1 Tax=Xylanibacter ruminicola TaxID=839 RepID=A0A928GGP3_XYLRU|nr:RHS repeat-associated core domain-containing protein [Xylanibacter ruminicola]